MHQTRNNEKSSGNSAAGFTEVSVSAAACGRFLVLTELSTMSIQAQARLTCSPSFMISWWNNGRHRCRGMWCRASTKTRRTSIVSLWTDASPRELYVYQTDRQTDRQTTQTLVTINTDQLPTGHTWNSWLWHLRQITNYKQFKRQLKTSLFKS